MKNSTKVTYVKIILMIVLVVIMCGLMSMFLSCKSVEKVVYKDVYHTDTVVVKEKIHDTTLTTNIVHDSVYEYVKDSSWMDSLGHYYHNRETYYYKIYNETSSMYKVLERENDSLRSVIDNRTDSVSNTSVVYRDNIIYRTNPWPVVVIIILVVAIGFYFIRKYWNNIKTFFRTIIDKIKQWTTSTH